MKLKLASKDKTPDILPGRRTGYIAFMNRKPWQVRLLVMLSLITVFYWLGYVDSRYIGSMMILIAAFFPDYMFKKTVQIDTIRNMPAMLHREVRNGKSILRVGMEEAPLTAVKKVAISQYSSDHVFIDFPYTARITAPLLFPIEQDAKVRQWFADNAPELEIIE